MIVNNKILLASNPFIDAYIHSDILGKLIFIGLVILSIASWVVMLHKLWLTNKAKRNSSQFYELFQKQRHNPLQLETKHQKEINPFFEIYLTLKKQTLDLLNKNRRFGQGDTEVFLSPSDVEFVDLQLNSTIASQTKYLEKNLFILSTVVTLGPFLGLLGTVWGILTTFSDLQTQTAGNTSQMVLGGLSLALATTVLGLLDAIPALIGYNYLKNSIQSYQIDMEGFSTEVLGAVEIQYRKVDIR